MPIYEYDCSSCKKTIEIIQGINDSPKRKCPECGGKIKKIVSLNSFQLKGGGWYKDGYASTAKNTAPKVDAPKKPEKAASGSKEKAK